MPTVPEIIEIAKGSQYLAADYTDKNSIIYNGSKTTKILSSNIYRIRKSVEWMYNLSPNYTGLQGVANYLLSLCGMFGLTAQAIISSGGGTVTPGTPGIIQPYLIPITSADFANATEYNNPEIVGKNLAIFWNDIPRYIYSPSEWVNTATGINILIGGFDATINDYTLYIYIIN